MPDVLQEPPDWPMLDDDIMSNFDHEVDQAVAQKLRDEKVLAPYPGWDFWACCWFSKGQFHAAVNTYRVHRATISAATPEELMKAVSDKFGWA